MTNAELEFIINLIDSSISSTSLSLEPVMMLGLRAEQGKGGKGGKEYEL